MPPAFRNHRVPTAGGTSAAAAASSLAMPAAIATQNRRRSSRPATGGRPGDRNGARPDRSDLRFRLSIATASVKVLRRPLDPAQSALVRRSEFSEAQRAAASGDQQRGRRDRGEEDQGDSQARQNGGGEHV